LPKAWPTGFVEGLCARDGFVVDMAWDKDVLTHMTIHSKLGRPCMLRYGKHEISLKSEAGKDYAFNGNLVPENPQ
jgi:alpha-L-fucosidase 2